MRRSMRGKVIWGALAAALAFALAAGGLRAQTAKADRVRAVMELSGLNATIAQVPAMASTRVKERAKDLPPKVALKLGKAVEEAFRADPLQKVVEASVAEGFDDALLDENLAWLRSPLGRKITQAEVDASDPANDAQLNAYAENLQKAPPPKPRVELVIRILSATGAVEATTEATVMMMEPVLQAMNALADEDKRLPAEQMDLMMQQIRERLRQPLANVVVVRTLYSYRNLSDPELSQYADFLESKAGQTMYRQLNNGLITGLRHSSQTLAGNFSEVFKE